MEVPAPAGGTVKELQVKLGDKVGEGTVILTMEAAPPQPQPRSAAAPTRRRRRKAAAAPAAEPQRRCRDSARRSAAAPAQPRTSAEAADRRAPQPRPSSCPSGGAPPHASPAVRRFARELGVDLQRVTGTGPKDRITQGRRAGLREGRAVRGARPPPRPAAAGLASWASRMAEGGLRQVRARSRAQPLLAHPEDLRRRASRATG